MRCWVQALGGPGVVAAIIGAFVASVGLFLKYRWDSKQLRIATLEGQLGKLYGPIVFLQTHNKLMLDQSNALRIAGNKLNQQSRSHSDEVSANIAVQNTYAGLAARNNLDILRILRENYHLLDDEDRDVSHVAALAHTRLEVEGSVGKDKAPLPPDVALMLDSPIFYMPPEFTERMQAKFASKQAKVLELRGA